jgi:hypothetical protein
VAFVLLEPAGAASSTCSCAPSSAVVGEAGAWTARRRHTRPWLAGTCALCPPDVAPARPPATTGGRIRLQFCGSDASTRGSRAMVGPIGAGARRPGGSPPTVPHARQVARIAGATESPARSPRPSPDRAPPRGAAGGRPGG